MVLKEYRLIKIFSSLARYYFEIHYFEGHDNVRGIVHYFKDFLKGEKRCNVPL